MVIRSLIFLAMLTLCVPCSAAFIVEIQSTPSYLAGTSHNPINVVLKTSAGSGSAEVFGFDLKFDFGPPGTGLPAGITPSAGITPTTAFLTNTLLNAGFGTTSRTPESGVDFYISGDNNGTAVMVDEAGLTLFSMNFDVASNVATDSYQMLSVPGNGISNILGTGFVEFTFTATPGALNVLSITAVPEPMTIGLMGLALVGGAGAVRRRLARKK